MSLKSESIREISCLIILATGFPVRTSRVYAQADAAF